MAKLLGEDESYAKQYPKLQSRKFTFSAKKQRFLGTHTSGLRSGI